MMVLLPFGLLLSQPLSEMSDEDLLLKFQGWDSSGRGLEKELQESNEDELVIRLIENKRMHQFLPAMSAHLPTGSARDKLILFCLRNDDIWRDVADPRFEMAARRLAWPAIANELQLSKSDEKEASLALCLMTSAGRSAVLNLVEDVIALDRKDRRMDHPTMAALNAKAKTLLAFYGSEDFVEANIYRSKAAPDPSPSPRQNSTASATGETSPDRQSGQAADSCTLLLKRQEILFGLGISAAVLLGAVVVKKWAF